MTSGAETPETASNPEKESEGHDTPIPKEVESIESTPEKTEESSEFLTPALSFLFAE